MILLYFRLLATITLVSSFALSGSVHAAEQDVKQGCIVDGPVELIPPQLAQIRLGMSKRALESVLGEPDYSPAEGQYYFSTGGDCPLGSENRSAGCGVVAGFRKLNGSDVQLTDALQSCSWGAIAE